MTFDYYFNIFFLSSHSPLIFTFPEPLKNSTLVQRSDASELSFFLFIFAYLSICTGSVCNFSTKVYLLQYTEYLQQHSESYSLLFF